MVVGFSKQCTRNRTDQAARIRQVGIVTLNGELEVRQRRIVLDESGIAIEDVQIALRRIKSLLEIAVQRRCVNAICPFRTSFGI